MFNMNKSSNPVLKEDDFSRSAQYGSTSVMTINGTVNKSFLLVALTIMSAFYVWNIFVTSGQPGAITPYLYGGAIGGFVVALITVFKKEIANITAPIYGVLQGFVIGGLAAQLEVYYPGIAFQAAGITFCIFSALLFAYKMGHIKVTENFRNMVVIGTMGIALTYVLSFILSFFGMSFPFIHDSGPIGIGFSLFVVGLASLNLVLDFDFIHRGSRNNLPAYMEWYAAFGLLVTLVWLYIEVLRLLSKLRSRD